MLNRKVRLVSFSEENLTITETEGNDVFKLAANITYTDGKSETQNLTLAEIEGYRPLLGSKNQDLLDLLLSFDKKSTQIANMMKQEILTSKNGVASEATSSKALQLAQQTLNEFMTKHEVIKNKWNKPTSHAKSPTGLFNLTEGHGPQAARDLQETASVRVKLK